MLFDPHPHISRAAHIGIPALMVCVGLLSPVAASGKTRHESGASASPPSAANTSSPSTANLESTVPSPEPIAAPSVEPGADTSSEARLARHEERRKQREERRAARAVDGEAGCAIELQPPAPVTAGDPASLLGSLSCPAADVAGQAVTIYQKVPHTPGFVLAGTTTTEADGVFQFTPSELDINSVFYAISDGAKSDRTRVTVTPVVTLTAPAAGTRLFTGAARGLAGASVSNAVTFTGNISPAGTGAVVALQREDGNDGLWHRIGVGRVGKEGAYSITHTFHKSGNANIRVVVHLPGLHMVAASEPATYQISRRQHERLTIQASADTIFYGQSVTISGAVARAVDQPVTLLAQTSTSAFAPVAEGTTNGSGEYAFIESPLENTRYRVISGDARSVALSEDVAYALITEPSASTVQAGGQLTVSGSVNPTHAVQTVHLEQQNSSGVGFHVVASGTVGSDSSYSIAFAASRPGTEILRVTVPGDGQNGAVASAPFSVQVRPASGP